MPFFTPRFLDTRRLTTRRLYGARKYYEGVTSFLFKQASQQTASGNPNLLNIWTASPSYGKVDTAGRLVLPNEKFLLHGADTGALVGQQWLTEAAVDFRSYMNRALRHGRTQLAEVFGDFRIKKSYVSVMSDYLEHAYWIMSRFNEKIISSNQRISTFEDYIALFVAHLRTLEDPFTFSNYFASGRTPINATGMTIQFEVADANNDFLKNKFFETDEFNKYAQAAANFGFRVNQNVPWMLIADIRSAPIEKYLIRDSIPTPEALFTRRYRSVLELEALVTPDVLYRSFDDYTRRYKFQFKTKLCTRPPTNFKIATSISVDKSQQIKLPIQPMSGPQFDMQYAQNRSLLLRLLEALHRADDNTLNPRQHARFYKRFVSFLDRGNNVFATRALETFYNPFNHLSR
jgi:hypothetical protein